MKKLLLITLTLSLSVAQVMRADNDSDKRKHKRQPEATAPVKHAAHTGPAQQTQRRTVPAQKTVTHRPRANSSTQRQPVRGQTRLSGRNYSGNQVASNRNINRSRSKSQVSMQRSHSNRSFNRNSFSIARGNVIRTRHDRGWWRSHYNTTFVLFGGGYYYWNAGYWYPAYGYSPIYNNYAYSEPIYGYNNLSPGRVIENVQIALRHEGYYSGAIDGLVGLQTRNALSAYQRDHGLVVTAALDEPTLVTLGLA